MSSLVSRAVLVSVHGHKQLSTSAALFGRATPQHEWEGKMAQLPPLILMLANLALFIPAIFYVSYTLGHVMPTLASVESSQDTYEPIPSNDDDLVQGKGEKSGKAAMPQAEEAGAIKRGPVTTSIRATQKHLCSVSTSSWRALFRGLGLAFTIHVLSGFIVAQHRLGPHRHLHLGSAVVAPPPPPFVETLRATFLPLCAVVLSIAACSGVPTLVLLAMGRPMVEREVGPNLVVQTVEKQGGDFVIFFGLWFALMVFAAYPAHVVLTRVQASLLPDSDETIVSFDRSLGRTTPHPSACQRMMDAYNSFSGSWMRFYKMVVKSILVAMAVGAAFGVIVGAEIGLLSYFSD
ncbi:ubiquitin carrier protein [Apiospora kogelbergensis]|uniref:ubiquitin carrier protein n=1 Tax=Apiospora kogelbergensis TaxID=1337665 RepID=UPI00312D2AF8